MIKRRGGFTLVELLVVVAIIIILAAILFPVFAKARDRANATKCLNNLKQLGTAIQMYEDDYAGAVLPWCVYGQPGQTEAAWIPGYFWQDLVNPYVKQLRKGTTGGSARGQGELLRCPAAPTETANQGVSWQTGKHYGYNRYLTRTTSPTEVLYPSLTLRLTESASYTFDVHNPASWGSNKDPGYKGGSMLAPIPSQQNTGLMLQAPGWHDGYNHVLWFDAHVSAIPWQRVMYTDNQSTDINVWCRLAPKDGYTPEG